ncbi:hypothetical protein E3N88_32423 [Mikania micrantha]|uniref:Uncharacterized protein n=1 Tax=Mikania micrantha TaxID=192012 RepID=A0A5N6M8G6_9ASTR|nr:hypothetical protein E3N88_32423 [Mikania micrantha]
MRTSDPTNAPFVTFPSNNSQNKGQHSSGSSQQQFYPAHFMPQGPIPYPYPCFYMPQPTQNQPLTPQHPPALPEAKQTQTNQQTQPQQQSFFTTGVADWSSLPDDLSDFSGQIFTGASSHGVENVFVNLALMAIDSNDHSGSTSSRLGIGIILSKLQQRSAALRLLTKN